MTHKSPTLPAGASCAGALSNTPESGNRTTRRAVLAGAVSTIPAAALASVPALAAGPDPIFSAIERHRRCYAAFGAAETAAENRGTDLDDDTVNALCAPIHDAEWHLANMPPTSLAGAAALFRYAVEFEDREGEWHPEWWQELAHSFGATFEKLAVAS